MWRARMVVWCLFDFSKSSYFLSSRKTWYGLSSCEVGYTVQGVMLCVTCSGNCVHYGEVTQLVSEYKPFLFAVGGPAEKAGLKKNDVVISVNGQSVLHYSHRDVVSLIYHTETPGVWLSVCEPTQRSSLGENFGRSLGSFSMSQSTPILQRNMMEPRRTAYRDGPPPRY